MRLHGLLGGGKYVFLCKACGKLRASARGACPGNSLVPRLPREKCGLETRLPREMEPFNRCNLVESGTAIIHTATLYIPDCLLNTVLIPCLLVFFLSIRRMSVNSRAAIQAYSGSAHGYMNIHILSYLAQELCACVFTHRCTCKSFTPWRRAILLVSYSESVVQGREGEKS